MKLGAYIEDEEEYKIFDIRLGFFCDYFIFLLEYRRLKNVSTFI